MDESFVAQRTRIKLIDGNEELVENLKTGDDVLTYDFESKRVIFSKITSITEQEFPEGVKISAMDLEVVCSPNSTLFTESTETGLILAKDAQEGEIILYFDMFSAVVGTVTALSKITKPMKFYSLKVSEYGNFIGNDILLKC